MKASQLFVLASAIFAAPHIPAWFAAFLAVTYLCLSLYSLWVEENP